MGFFDNDDENLNRNKSGILDEFALFDAVENFEIQLASHDDKLDEGTEA